MSATPSILARILPLSALPSVELGKPIGSVASLRPPTSLRVVANHQPAPRRASLFMLPNEPEDARLTGGTRSLDRRLLALNFSRVRSGIDAA